MKAIGLGHHTKEPTGLRRITTATGSLWVTGKEIAAALSTITTGTAIETETSTTMTDMVITTEMVITTTAGTIGSPPRRSRSVALAAQLSRF